MKKVLVYKLEVAMEPEQANPAALLDALRKLPGVEAAGIVSSQMRKAGP